MENEVKPNEGLIKIDENEYKITSDMEIEDINPGQKVVDNSEFEYSLKGLYDYITTRNTKELGLLLLRFIIVVAILFVCKYPFELLKDIGLSLFDVFNGNIATEFVKVWYFICELCYYVFAIIAFIKIMTKRYDNLLKKKIVEDK